MPVSELMAFDALADRLAEINDRIELPDVAFYQALAERAQGTVVELGVGDGRSAKRPFLMPVR